MKKSDLNKTSYKWDKIQNIRYVKFM